MAPQHPFVPHAEPVERDPLKKPAKGSGLMERKDRRREIVAVEEAAKDAVRARDKSCRWPFCENCKRYKPRLEAAHNPPKGMGGDHSERSAPEDMILLDFLTHQGAGGLEQHGKRIEWLTPQRNAGPCQFWAKDDSGAWYLVAEEYALHCYVRD